MQAILVVCNARNFLRFLEGEREIDRKVFIALPFKGDFQLVNNS